MIEARSGDFVLHLVGNCRRPLIRPWHDDCGRRSAQTEKVESRVIQLKQLQVAIDLRNGTVLIDLVDVCPEGLDFQIIALGNVDDRSSADNCPSRVKVSSEA